MVSRIFLVLLIGIFLSGARCQNQTIYQALKSLSNDTSLSFNVTGGEETNANASSVSMFYLLVDASPSVKSLLDSNTSDLVLFAPINYAFTSIGTNVTSNLSEIPIPIGANSTEKPVTFPIQNITEAHVYRASNQSYPPLKEESPSLMNFTGLLALDLASPNSSKSIVVVNATNSSFYLSFSGVSTPSKLLSNRTGNTSSPLPYYVTCTNGIIVFVKNIITPQIPLNATTIGKILGNPAQSNVSTPNSTLSAPNSTAPMPNSTISIPNLMALQANATAQAQRPKLLSMKFLTIFAVSDSASSSTSYNDSVLSNQIFKSAQNSSDLIISSPLLFNIASNSSNVTLISLSGLPLNISMSTMKNSSQPTSISQLLFNQTVTVLCADLLFQNSTIFIVDKPFLSAPISNSSSGINPIRPKSPIGHPI
ncbi:hypothetical protein MDAP_001090 [Mitosporidium daphniae]